MSFPIKFRVWSKLSNKWMNSISITSAGTPILSYSEKNKEDKVVHQIFLVDNYEPVVQFYTGIKDSDGFPIFEGDIIQLEDGTRGEVKYDNGVWYHTASDVNNATNTLYWFKRIGNIFENPKILEKQNEQSTETV